MKQDRFLLFILLFIALLAAAAVILFFQRQGAQEYGSEETPRGVARNYLLALEKGDLERAYGYLREGQGKPSLESFRQAALNGPMDLSRTSAVIGETRLSGRDAIIEMTIIHGGGGPFEDGYRETGRAALQQDASGAWKISNMPYAYWNWDWYSTQAVKP